MKLAIICDVHGNLAALEAVARDLDRVVGLQHVLVGGDICLGGLEPAECIDFLRQREWSAILGNTDRYITEEVVPAGPAASLLDWTRRSLDSDHMLYLAELPFQLRMVPEEGHDLYLVHATPWDIEEAVQPDAPEDLVERIFEEARANLVVYGHVHKQHRRELRGRVLVNPGSVGFPFDWDPRPAYALFTWDGRWHVQLRRVERGYDPERIARRYAAHHPYGAIWAQRIRTARA
ncbi:MAG: metallophosphoesterase family protein [Armatimonadota bacterium]|nr:metallophosphoesterase family protein [Armatimonadota bacterium]